MHLRTNSKISNLGTPACRHAQAHMYLRRTQAHTHTHNSHSKLITHTPQTFANLLKSASVWLQAFASRDESIPQAQSTRYWPKMREERRVPPVLALVNHNKHSCSQTLSTQFRPLCMYMCTCQRGFSMACIVMGVIVVVYVVMACYRDC